MFTNSLRGCSSVGHGCVGVLCANSAVLFCVLLTFSIPFHSIPHFINDQCTLVVFTLESGLGRCELKVYWTNPHMEVESEPNSLFIHRITIKSCTVTPPQTATSSKLGLLGHHTCSIHHLRYELRWPVMLGQYWLDAAKKETTYQVVSCNSSKFTLHVFYYQRQGKGNNWTDFSVCFGTSRMLAQ